MSRVRKPWKVWSKSREQAFLQTLALYGNVSEASRSIGLESNSSVYLHRRESKEFAAAWDDAVGQAADRLEKEAHRRAHDGIDEPVFYQGMQCGTMRKYSDSLMIFLLKGAKPEKYRERLEHTGGDGGPIRIDLTVDERDSRLAAILDAARARRDGPAAADNPEVEPTPGTADTSLPK